jgi:hypothetical protein
VSDVIRVLGVRFQVSGKRKKLKPERWKLSKHALGMAFAGEMIVIFVGSNYHG